MNAPEVRGTACHRGACAPGHRHGNTPDSRSRVIRWTFGGKPLGLASPDNVVVYSALQADTVVDNGAKASTGWAYLLSTPCTHTPRQRSHANTGPHQSPTE